jgi:iron complex transport system permease protein
MNEETRKMNGRQDLSGRSPIMGGSRLKPPMTAQQRRHRFFQKWWPLLFLLPVTLFFISFVIGRYPLNLKDFLETFYWHFQDPSRISDPNMEIVIFNVRLPRVLVVLMVGAGISMAGAAYQGMFRNPLVSPDILGVSAGASFGAALAIIHSSTIATTQVSALIFALLAVILSIQFERFISTDPILALVLGGMLIRGLFNAGLSIVKYLSDPDAQLPAITFWLMGSFSDVFPRHVLQVLIPFIPSCFLLFINRNKLNVMSFSEEEARAIGVKTKRVRREVILACTIITASSIAICGQIGWVGLVIPHVTRSLVGPNYRLLLPVSGILGSAYLLICDTICRNAFSVELPIGILTSLIGIPFFIIIFKQRAGRT